MTTVEKLFVQIFERKSSIIQQVKQQTDLYNQHLVSKLLVDGISPPPWLWNPNQSTSDVQKVLNKEELISEILLPRPPPAVRFSSAYCSQYNRPVESGDNGELLGGPTKDIYSYNGGDAEARQAIVASCYDNNTRCNVNSPPEQDLSVNSPQDETEARMSNIYGAPSQSLARIQRSRSRQKALELRCSGKADCKSHPSLKNVSVDSTARNIGCIFSSEKVDKFHDSQECVEPCDIRHENCGAGESSKGDNRDKEKATACSTGKDTRFKNSAEKLSSGVGFLKFDSSCNSIQRSDSTPVQYEEEFSKCADVVNELPETVSTSGVTGDNCGGAMADDSWRNKEKGTGNRDCKIPSCSQQYCYVNEDPAFNISIHSAKADGGIFDHSVQHFGNGNPSEETTLPLEGLTLERARLGSTSSQEILPTVSDTSSLADHRDKTSSSSRKESPKANEAERISSGEAIMPRHDSCNISHQQIHTEAIAASGLTSYDLMKGPLANSRLDIDHTGTEGLVSKLSANRLVFLEPKQLDFDDSKEHNFDECLSSENRRLEKSPKTELGAPLDPLATSDEFNKTMPEKPSSAEPDISTKQVEICRSSPESTSQEHVNIQSKEYTSHAVGNPMLEATQEDSEIVLHVQNSPKKVFGSSSDHQITYEDFHNTMPQNCSTAEPEILTKEVEVCGDPHESISEERVNIQLKEYSSHTIGHPILETPQEDSEIVLHVQNSNFDHQIDMACCNATESSDTKDWANRRDWKECKSPPELQIDEGHYGTEGRERRTSASFASKRKDLEMNFDKGENALITCDFVGYPLGNHQNCNLSKSEKLKFATTSQPFRTGSWPKTKRRKIEGQEMDSYSAYLSYSKQMHNCGQTGLKSMNIEKVEDNVVTVFKYASPVNDSTSEVVKQKMTCQLNEEMKPSTEADNRQRAICSEGLDEHLGSSSNLQEVADPILSTFAEEAASFRQECLIEKEELETPANLQKDDDKLHKVQGEMVNTKGSNFIESTIYEKTYLEVDGGLSHHLEHTPYKRDLELIGVDQSMPELQGFIIDSQTEDEELEISGSQINFDKLHLPRTSIERASILEQICKSASQQALSTQFSSSFKLHGFQKPYQSLPNGLLECIDLTGISALSKDLDEEVRSNCMDDVNVSLQERSYSDSLPYSGSQLGWSLHNSYASPVGKLWEKMPMHNGSSGKRLSSNPELICFPIEEDPSDSEECENDGGDSDKIQHDIVLSTSSSAKREPLADITEPCLNAQSPVAEADKLLSEGGGNSVTKDASFCDTYHKANRKIGNYGKDKSLGKENNILSFGGDGIKMSKASLNGRSSKVNSSCKTSTRKGRKKLSEKEPKRNNIVSNLTSFLPLVQQKQAAAQCKGKRDIKVKALEAAEAAKRLEEKKENERKMRKEALKNERARLEQENLRQKELEKKRKLEERKKKDTDILAKKRQREEEEKKEKERKRKRLDEARQQQREDGKRLEKVDKAKQIPVIIENDKANKEANSDLKRSQDSIPLEKPETKLMPNGFISHVQDAVILEARHTSTDSCDHTKEMPACNTSPKTNILAVKEVHEKSYEISPYQCSDDDEEEEEDDIPNKKFVPSWSKRSSVALVLPLQQGIDPDTIFPPDSFCMTDEVFPPRSQSMNNRYS